MSNEPKVKVIRTIEKNINMMNSIYIGDPLYIDEYSSGEMDLNKFNSIALLKKFRNKNSWVGNIKLSEVLVSFNEMDIKDFYIDVILAPTEEALKIYNDGKIYKGQREKVSPIGVDTAEYVIGIEDREIKIGTGGDGKYGTVVELYNKSKLEGLIINLSTGNISEWERLKQDLEYLFKIKF